MRKSILLFFIPFICGISFLSNAQTDEENVVIANSNESYFFRMEKSRVVVKSKTSTQYECTKRGTSIHIMEGYNQQIKLDKVSGKKISTPQYSQYSSDDMFYTDQKICHFNLYFDRKGSKGEIKFEKTFLDPRYFCTIYFPAEQYIRKKTVSIDVPDWMDVDLVEYNFGENIIKEVVRDENNKSYTYHYTITNQPAMVEENHMRGRSYIYPHILVLTKSSTSGGIKTTYFETLANQYEWYRTILEELNNDKTTIEAKAKEIIRNCRTDEEKIKALFGWVQENIRYLAFLDGIAAFKPEDAQEVLRKKYGDCKGMSNLLQVLLECEGFDARLAWLGTRHIAYNYSTPSLAVDNHMICALFYGDSIYYLDPTIKYMPLGEYPQATQGRQVLIEGKDRNDYLLKQIPVMNPEMNLDSLSCIYELNGNTLQGKAVQIYKGESKQLLSELMDATPKDRQNEALKNFLENNTSKNTAEHIKVNGALAQAPQIEITYQYVNRSGVYQSDKMYYIDIDQGKEFLNSTIDINTRINGIEFMHKHHCVRHFILNIPSGYEVSHLPESLHIQRDGYVFRLEYKIENNQIIYHKELTIREDYLPQTNFNEWNNDIRSLKNAYMEQIILNAI